MCLYLVQHGEAVAESVDPNRPLSVHGRAIIEQVAAWAARRGVRVDQIRHSGKLRAEQTAAIFAEQLGPREGVSVEPGLAPNDDVQPLADGVEGWPGSLMLVGHLPFLSRLTSLLLIGDPQHTVIQFCNGGLVSLVRDKRDWAIVCVIPPVLIGQD
jgi:phosphohistidine phosphatase